MEIEESKENPLQFNRFQVDEMHNNINMVEWNKKRKLQCYPLDLLRPKHRCRVGSLSSENDSTFDVNRAAFLDNRSEPESAKDSNSFIEDSDTSMSVNEEAKLEETFVDSKYNGMNRFYEDPDTLAYEYLDDHLLELGSFPGHSEYVKDSSDPSVDKEFEDFAFSNGVVNPNVLVLLSGSLDVEQEAESSTKPPTIDQEFEQYFSALML